MTHHFILLQLNPSTLRRLGGIVVSTLCVIVAGLLIKLGAKNVFQSDWLKAFLIKFNLKISAYQKSNWFITFCLRYSWFKNYAVWLGESIFNLPKLKFTNHLLHILNLFLSGKNQVDSSIFSWEKADLRILQSDRLRAFWLITQEPEFSKIWDLYRHAANNMNFHSTQMNFH